MSCDSSRDCIYSYAVGLRSIDRTVVIRNFAITSIDCFHSCRWNLFHRCFIDLEIEITISLYGVILQLLAIIPIVKDKVIVARFGVECKHFIKCAINFTLVDRRFTRPCAEKLTVAPCIKSERIPTGIVNHIYVMQSRRYLRQLCRD